ncbi:MAG TPA: hypothetical protein VGT61_04035 [Thermomicrobiales bacterium]|nr:hypothetical protein [Thermomicrobiales bacterium]
MSERATGHWGGVDGRGGDGRDDMVRIVIDDSRPPARPLELLDAVPGGCVVRLTTSLADRLGLAGETEVLLDSLRSALAAAGIALQDNDHLFFLPIAEQSVVRDESTPSNVRQLTADDAEAFTRFTETASPAELGEAYVELDH